MLILMMSIGLIASANVADHLGSVRATVGETGSIEQTVAYYAMGGVIADLGRNRDLQQHKYIGKELDLTHGLAEYDHGARRYRAALLGFSQPDALAESYPWLNPYLYCAANPVNLADRDGRRIFHEIDGKEYEYRNIDNTWGFYDKDGNMYEGENAVLTALNALNGPNLIGDIIKDLVRTDVTVRLHSDETLERNSFEGDRFGGNIDIKWNPSNWEGGIGVDSSGNLSQARDPISGLSHEIGHAYDYIYLSSFDKLPLYMSNPLLSIYDADEIVPCIIENSVRELHGDPIRKSYKVIKDGNNISIDKHTLINYSESHLKQLFKIINQKR